MQADSRYQPVEVFHKRINLGIDTSIEILSDIIEFEKNNERRKEAIKYLGLFREKSCFKLFENLIISDENIDIKCEAAKALGRLKEKKGL